MERRWLTLMVLLCCALAGARAQGGLCISELLYQPRSGEAEYVELYNNSDDSVNLADYHIVRWVGDSLGKHYPLPAFAVKPRGYVALTKDVLSVTSCYSTQYPPPDCSMQFAAVS